MSKEQTYFVRMSFGIPACDNTDLITVTCLKEAETTARELTIDSASSYGYEQDVEFFGDYDSVGSDWCEEEECYTSEGGY